VLQLVLPPPARLYSWSSGALERVDEGLLVSLASAPEYGLKVWKLGEGAGLTAPVQSHSNSSSSSNAHASMNAPPELVREQHVYGNPMLEHVAQQNGGRATPHPLDPVSSGHRAHWSCIDVFAGPPLPSSSFADGSGGHCGFDPYEASSYGAASDPYASLSASSAFASSSSSSSSSSSHPRTPPPRSSSFLLFAAMQRPLVYLYDLATRKMRPFAEGHTSAICCVRVGRPSVNPAVMPFFDCSNDGHSTSVGNAPPPPPQRLAVSGGYDHAACVWDVDTGARVARLTGGCRHTVWCVDVHAPSFSSSSSSARGGGSTSSCGLSRRLVAAGADDGVVRVWALDLRPGEPDPEQAFEEARMSEQQRVDKRLAEKHEAMRKMLQPAQDNNGTDDEQKASTTPVLSEREMFAPVFTAAAVAAAAAVWDAPFQPEPIPDPFAVAGAAPVAAPIAAAPPAAGAGAAAAVAGGANGAAGHRARPVLPDEGGSLLLVLEGHTGSPMTLQFDPARPTERLWSAGYDKTIRLWDISKRAGDQNPASSAAAAASSSPSASAEAASAAASSSDAAVVPAVSPRWSSSGRCLRVFSGHTGVVFGLCVLPHVLVSSSRDGSVRVWDRDSGALVRCLESGRSSSALSDDISAASLSSEQVRGSLASSRTQSREIKCVTVTHGGDILAASSDGKIQCFSFEQRRSGGGGGGGNNAGGGASSIRPGPVSFIRANSQPGGGGGEGGNDNSPPQQDGCAVM
jgi:WD40 repeat protein